MWYKCCWLCPPLRRRQTAQTQTMSVSRTIASRRDRRQQSLPYARPRQKPASSWSFSNILKYIIPSRSEELEEEEQGEEQQESDTDDSNNDSEPPNARMTMPPPPPSPRRAEQAAPSFLRTPVKAPDVLTQPPDNLQTVSNFLSHRTESGMSGREVEQLLTTIQKCTPRFRFDSIPPSAPFDSNSTPTRPLSTPAGTPSASPRKTLSKNPNGVYRWEGAGSAKQSRSRNRYASPAFGASHSTPERLVMKEISSSQEPRSDSKRRKVDDESVEETSSNAETSTNGSSLPFPTSGSPTVSRANGVFPKVPSTPSRLRIPTVQKPTAPANPSPLRQAWSDASSTSPNDGKQSPPPPRQSKAANFMAELIKEVTPPRKPDVSNPYQTASPVSKVGPPRRANKRLRATGKPTVPAVVEKMPEEEDAKANASNEKEERQKEYSPQAIIEATVPKGSKRSRPPAHLERSPSAPASSNASSSRMSTPSQHEDQVVVEDRKVPYVVEELDEDEDESYRKAKKSKPSANGRGSTSKSNLTIVAPSPDVVVEEIVDVAMEESENSVTSSTARSVSPTTSAPRASFSFKSTSAPKEPSKLRYSYQPDGNLTPLKPASAPEVAPTPTFNFAASAAASAFTFAVPKEPKVDAVGDKKDAKESDARAKALAADVSSLPTFDFTCNVTTVYPSTPAHVEARRIAASLPLSSLPTFDFNVKNTNASASSSRLEPAATPFASGATKPTAAFNSDMSFSTSTLFKPAPANTPPDVPHLSDASKAPPKAFDWSAAGVKPPPTATASGGNWTCSMCMLSNPTTATEKCGICDNPR